MPRLPLWSCLSLSLCLVACAGAPPRASIPAAPGAAGTQLNLALASGVYVCEQGVRLQLVRERQGLPDERILLNWRGRRYELVRDPSFSGLPRFESREQGLLWIDLPWKGLLLDSRSGQPLANECRAA